MKNQVVNRLTIGIKLLFILVSLVLVGLIFILFAITYEGLLKAITEHYGEPDKIHRLKTDYLTIHTFEYLRYFLLFFTAAFMVCYFLFRRSIHVISLFLYGTFTQMVDLVKRSFKELSRLTPFQKITFIIFFAVVIASRIFYLFKFPLVHDEIFSYLYLVNKGFFPSAVYYPGPNNHIFFSELCVVWDVAINDPMLIMRLPALLAGILVVFVMFVTVNRKLGFEVALLSSTLFAFSYNIFFYSIHGRGYAMLYLFFVIAFFSMLKITEEGGVKRIYKILFIVSSVMGLYTIPVFVYPYACLFIFGLSYFVIYNGWKESLHFLILNIFVMLFVVFLYLPVFFLNGVDAVTGNSWVKPLSYDEFFSRAGEYLINTYDYLWNVRMGGWIFTLLLSIAGIIVLFKIRYGKIAVCITLLILLPFLFLAIQRVLPFFRVWDYLLVVYAVLFGVLVQMIIENTFLGKYNNLIIASMSALIIAANIYVVQSEVQNGFPYYTRLNNFMNRLFKEKVERVYVGEDTYHLVMEFKAEEEKHPIQIYTQKSPYFFDMVILPAGQAFPSFINPKHYQPYIFNGYIRSYKKK